MRSAKKVWRHVVILQWHSSLNSTIDAGLGSYCSCYQMGFSRSRSFALLIKKVGCSFIDEEDTIRLSLLSMLLDGAMVNRGL